MIEVKPYSCYDNYTVTSQTENVSNIVDKLIRLTAKITESYASDIWFDISDLYECVEQGESCSRILFFRESGVSAMDYDKINELHEYIQAWSLVYNPDITTTILTRVNVREVNR